MEKGIKCRIVIIVDKALRTCKNDYHNWLILRTERVYVYKY